MTARSTRRRIGGACEAWRGLSGLVRIPRVGGNGKAVPYRISPLHACTFSAWRAAAAECVLRARRGLFESCSLHKEAKHVPRAERAAQTCDCGRGARSRAARAARAAPLSE